MSLIMAAVEVAKMSETKKLFFNLDDCTIIKLMGKPGFKPFGELNRC